MTGKEAYRIWAPAGCKWTDWVRPVPFMAAGDVSRIYCDSDYAVPAAEYIDANNTGAAVSVDLPGAESVKEGIALAKAGYRPVPIYNGTVEQPGARAAVDNRSVGLALVMAARELERIEIRSDAPPAFLTDRFFPKEAKADAIRYPITMGIWVDGFTPDASRFAPFKTR